MSNKLKTINQDSKLVLAKAKNLMNITNKILENKTSDNLDINDKVWIDTDPDTNIMWQVDVDNKEYIRAEAFEYAKELNAKNYGGYNDWRVPTRDELEVNPK